MSFRFWFDIRRKLQNPVFGISFRVAPNTQVQRWVMFQLSKVLSSDLNIRRKLLMLVFVFGARRGGFFLPSGGSSGQASASSWRRRRHAQPSLSISWGPREAAGGSKSNRTVGKGVWLPFGSKITSCIAVYYWIPWRQLHISYHLFFCWWKDIKLITKLTFIWLQDMGTA